MILYTQYDSSGVGTRGAGAAAPLVLKQGAQPPKIDLVNHIHYAYSHSSLLQSRLTMTIYIAIKAQ